MQQLEKSRSKIFGKHAKMPWRIRSMETLSALVSLYNTYWVSHSV